MTAMSHAHASIVDTIGPKVIMSHYNIKPRSLRLWRANGIPRIHHNSLRLLAQLRGVQIGELS